MKEPCKIHQEQEESAGLQRLQENILHHFDGVFNLFQCGNDNKICFKIFIQLPYHKQ